MRWNLIGAFKRNWPFGTEIAFKEGLHRIGEKVAVFDPSYPNDSKFLDNPDVTIIFKWLDEGPIRDAISNMPGKKILYQVDDLRFPHIQSMMQDMSKICKYALTFDDDGASMAMQYGFSNAKKLLLTANNNLYHPLGIYKKDIDICFVGSLSYGANHVSRVKMLNELKRYDGLNIFVANELFDIEKINNIYNRSKIVLNHATDVGQGFGKGYGLQCRIFEAGFANACVLSNKVVNEKLHGLVEFDNMESFLGNVFFLLKNDNVRKEYANTLFNTLCSYHTPEFRARELLNIVKEM